LYRLDPDGDWENPVIGILEKLDERLLVLRVVHMIVRVWHDNRTSIDRKNR